MLAIIVVVALGMVAMLATQLLRAPGITFALSVEVRAMELRLGSDGAVIRDIDSVNLGIDLGADAGHAPETANLLEDQKSDARRRFAFDASERASIKLEALLIPGTSLVELAHDAREHTVSIFVHEAGTGAQARIGWEGPVAVEGPDEAVTPGTKSVLLQSDELNLLLTQPQYPASLAAPFTVRGIRLEEIDNGPLATYPVSTIVTGQLRFFCYGVPLPVQALTPGMLIRFAALSAEVTHLSGDAATLGLRLYGVADDVQSGFGSRLRSIYPSAFEALGTLPSVRVAISTIFGVLIALIGAVAIRAEPDPREENQPTDAIRAEPQPEPKDASEKKETEVTE